MVIHNRKTVNTSNNNKTNELILYRLCRRFQKITKSLFLFPSLLSTLAPETLRFMNSIARYAGPEATNSITTVREWQTPGNKLTSVYQLQRYIAYLNVYKERGNGFTSGICNFFGPLKLWIGNNNLFSKFHFLI